VANGTQTLTLDPALRIPRLAVYRTGQAVVTDVGIDQGAVVEELAELQILESNSKYFIFFFMNGPNKLDCFTLSSLSSIM
jgi:hypothetical protein